jgi:hypothetical protein
MIKMNMFFEFITMILKNHMFNMHLRRFSKNVSSICFILQVVFLTK